MEREKGLDFIRVCSIFGIVFYHFSCHSACKYPLFLSYANGGFGVTFVAVFFMLSGACLYKNYGNCQRISLKSFYFKRWKSTLLPFYAVFLYCLLEKALINGRLFYIPEARPASLLLSLFGLDGYFLYKIPNYYCVGEWFLGAIVLIYAAYPVLQWFFNKSRGSILILFLILFSVILKTDFFEIDFTRNLITCLFSFTLGMWLIKNIRWFKTGPACAASILLSVISLTIPIPVLPNAKNWLFAACWFVALLNIGTYTGNHSGIHSVIERLSSLSYGIYLIHHVLILKVLSAWNPVEPLPAILTLIGVIVLTIIFSAVLAVVIDAVETSRGFTALNARFLR